MPTETFTLEDLIEAGFTLEVSRYADIPVNGPDRVLYADRSSGRLLIARAPVVFVREPSRVNAPGSPRAFSL
jgi:hypothetical protein